MNILLITIGILAALCGVPSFWGLRARLLPIARIWGVGFGAVAVGCFYLAC